MPKRDSNGRFVKGSSGNPGGRPPKEREQRYYEIALTTVTYKDWQAIVERAAKDAMRGDSTARTWLSGYLIGQPTQNNNSELSGQVEILVRHVKPDND